MWWPPVGEPGAAASEPRLFCAEGRGALWTCASNGVILGGSRAWVSGLIPQHMVANLERCSGLFSTFFPSLPAERGVQTGERRAQAPADKVPVSRGEPQVCVCGGGGMPACSEPYHQAARIPRFGWELFIQAPTPKDMWLMVTSLSPQTAAQCREKVSSRAQGGQSHLLPSTLSSTHPALAL